MHMGNGKGRLRSLDKDGELQKGYVTLRQGGERVLTTPLLWVFATMPKINYYTHPAYVYMRPRSIAADYS